MHPGWLCYCDAILFIDHNLDGYIFAIEPVAAMYRIFLRRHDDATKPPSRLVVLASPRTSAAYNGSQSIDDMSPGRNSSNLRIETNAGLIRGTA